MISEDEKQVLFIYFLIKKRVCDIVSSDYRL